MSPSNSAYIVTVEFLNFEFCNIEYNVGKIIRFSTDIVFNHTLIHEIYVNQCCNWSHTL